MAEELATFSFKGMDVLKQFIDKTQVKLKERSVVNHEAVIVLDRWIQKNFQGEGDLSGGWAPLAPSTIARRLAEKRTVAATKARSAQGRPSASIKILQDRGWLRSRWKHFFNASIGKITSAVDYGDYHDSDKPRKHLPQRKILPRKKDVMDQLMKLYGHFVKTSLGD
jgi:hypothetical protein